MHTLGGLIVRPIKNRYVKMTNIIVNAERRKENAVARRRAKNKVARRSRRINRMQ